MWLRTAPARAIEIVRATWMEDRQESVSFGDASENSADLEWRDSAEAACLKKRRRVPELSLIFLTGLFLGVPEVFPGGSKSSCLSRDSEAARPWESLTSSSWDERSRISRRASRYLAVTLERSARVAVWVCWRARSSAPVLPSARVCGVSDGGAVDRGVSGREEPTDPRPEPLIVMPLGSCKLRLAFATSSTISPSRARSSAASFFLVSSSIIFLSKSFTRPSLSSRSSLQLWPSLAREVSRDWRTSTSSLRRAASLSRCSTACWRSRMDSSARRRRASRSAMYCAEWVSASLYWVISLLREPMDSEEVRLDSSYCFSRSSRSLT